MKSNNKITTSEEEWDSYIKMLKNDWRPDLSHANSEQTTEGLKFEDDQISSVHNYSDLLYWKFTITTHF